jgi:hypothetical protein
MWWAVTGVGVAGAVLMLIYNRLFKTGPTDFRIEGLTDCPLILQAPGSWHLPADR